MFIPPIVARYLLPVLLLAAYAGYHWWRWCMLHPKINLDAMPDPAEETQLVGTMPPIAEAPPIEERVPTPEQRARLERFFARRAEQEAEARIAFEAYDPASIALAYHRARSRRPEFYVRLGEYAWRRGAMVETHFWVSLAKFNGVEGLDEWLDRIHKRWLLLHRPGEVKNVYEQFTLERGNISRAYLLYLSGYNAQLQYDVIMDLAQKGNRDARLFLKHIDHQKRTATYAA